MSGLKKGGVRGELVKERGGTHEGLEGKERGGEVRGELVKEMGGGRGREREE